MPIADTVCLRTSFDLERCGSFVLEEWMIRKLLGAALVCLLSCAPAFAQQTTGNVTGRVLDPQGAAIPGATVTARNAQTGFTRSETSDAEGVYRIGALPVGTYEINAELFSRRAPNRNRL